MKPCPSCGRPAGDVEFCPHCLSDLAAEGPGGNEAGTGAPAGTEAPGGNHEDTGALPDTGALADAEEPVGDEEVVEVLAPPAHRPGAAAPGAAAPGAAAPAHRPGAVAAAVLIDAGPRPAPTPDLLDGDVRPRCTAHPQRPVEGPCDLCGVPVCVACDPDLRPGYPPRCPACRHERLLAEGPARYRAVVREVSWSLLLYAGLVLGLAVVLRALFGGSMLGASTLVLGIVVAAPFIVVGVLLRLVEHPGLAWAGLALEALALVPLILAAPLSPTGIVFVILLVMTLMRCLELQRLARVLRPAAPAPG